MKKQDVLDLLERFPDEVDVEELMHSLYLREKLARAEAAVERGEVVRHEDVVERIRRGSPH